MLGLNKLYGYHDVEIHSIFMITYANYGLYFILYVLALLSYENSLIQWKYVSYYSQVAPEIIYTQHMVNPDGTSEIFSVVGWCNGLATIQCVN